MGLLTLREKRQLFGWAVTGILILALISVMITYWYITVPVILGLAAWLFSAIYRTRKNRVTNDK
jgi:hypothetical protein